VQQSLQESKMASMQIGQSIIVDDDITSLLLCYNILITFSFFYFVKKYFNFLSENPWFSEPFLRYNLSSLNKNKKEIN